MIFSQLFPFYYPWGCLQLWACHKMVVPVQCILLRNYAIQKQKEIISSIVFNFKDKENFLEPPSQFLSHCLELYTNPMPKLITVKGINTNIVGLRPIRINFLRLRIEQFLRMFMAMQKRTYTSSNQDCKQGRKTRKKKKNVG